MRLWERPTRASLILPGGSVLKQRQRKLAADATSDATGTPVVSALLSRVPSNADGPQFYGDVIRRRSKGRRHSSVRIQDCAAQTVGNPGGTCLW